MFALFNSCLSYTMILQTTWRGSVYVSGGCPSLPQASARTSLMRTADLPQASLFRLSVGASTTALAAEPSAFRVLMYLSFSLQTRSGSSQTAAAEAGGSQLCAARQSLLYLWWQRSNVAVLFHSWCVALAMSCERGLSKYIETGEWSIVKTYGTPPSPRAAHTAVVHRGSMYVFGGRSMSGAALDDLHRFDFGALFSFFVFLC